MSTASVFDSSGRNKGWLSGENFNSSLGIWACDEGVRDNNLNDTAASLESFSSGSVIIESKKEGILGIFTFVAMPTGAGNWKCWLRRLTVIH